MGNSDSAEARQGDSQRLTVKTFDEARATIQREARADRGFLSNRAIVGLVCAMLAGALFSWWVLITCASVMILDFIVFVVRRRSLLRTFESGTPRLVTSTDFARIDEAFQRTGQKQPSMTEYERAAGVAGHPSWRADLRYQNLIDLADLKPFHVVLDVGAGDGRLAWKYGVNDRVASFIGVDIAHDLLVELKTRVPHAQAVVCDLNVGLPFRNAAVDRVLCTEAFEHFAEPDKVLGEFARVVRHGGKIVIQSPSAMQLRNLNPFHVIQCLVGRFAPSILLPIVVHENTWVRAYTYHWDFTIQQLRRFTRPLGLRIGRTICAMYRFNPNGARPHRIGHWMSCSFPLNLLGWDRTIVMIRAAQDRANTSFDNSGQRSHARQGYEVRAGG